ncbi:MAG: hypothetical protein Q9199_005311 [Rusavskia elegans]
MVALVERHTISFFKDIEGTINDARQYFNNTREPVAFTVAGRTIYLLMSTNDIYAAQKAVEDLNHDVSTVNFMSRFGVTKPGLQILFEDPPPSLLASTTLEPNPGRKNMVHLGAALFVTQLTPGKYLDTVQETCLDLLDQKMALHNLLSNPRFRTANTTSRPISLVSWVSHTLIESTSAAFFGPALLRLEPDLARYFLEFDSKMWKLLYSIPRPWSDDMLAARSKLQNALVAYLELPADEKAGGSWFVSKFESEMRARDISTHDIAGCLAMVYWVANTNTWRLCFWILAYALHDPRLKEVITQEILPFTTNDQPVASLPATLSQCRQLSAVYHEVLRVVNSPISLRHVTSSARTASEKVLRPGTQVMMAHTQLLRDGQVFGTSPDTFDPSRFLNKEGLTKSRNFTPFGGGTRLCPGRFFAKAEIFAFIGLAIGRFEMSVHSTKGFPRPDWKSGAGMGILSPMEGDDVLLDVVPRREKA